MSTLMRRGTFVRTLAGGAAAAGLSPRWAASPAEAAAYPDRPITFIVPWGPGGGSDQMARALQRPLQQVLGVAVPIQDVPGGTGTVGLEKLVTAPADGYTIGDVIADTMARVATGSSAWKIGDLTAVCRLMDVPSFLFVNAQDDRFKTWEDLATYAKAHPNELKYGMLGVGSVDDMTRHYLATKGFRFTGVPYAKPSVRYASLLGRHVDVLYEQAGDVSQYVIGGQFRPLVIFAEKRLPQLPHVPAGPELGFKIFLPQIRGIVVAKGTDPAVVSRLSDAFKSAYESADFQRYIKNQFMYPESWMDAAQFQGFMAREFQTMLGYLNEFNMVHRS
ncbi:MAG: tripartite tricarboxylate transporter substrate binding protein [bacterium]|nr:tripartite tricarboxylate transporter substrate binding protein [bacterium]